MHHFFLKIFSAYQILFSAPIHFLSKTLFGMFDAGCRFYPRCSEYTYQAVQKYGIIKGSWLGLRRVVRCHPWGRGGIDELP